MQEIVIIGGGLAGAEAAWQAASLGVSVTLYEMRPARMTEAHRTGLLAELVCSNSLRSRELTTGAGLLKEELRMAGSLVMAAADSHRVAAGSALAVDRTRFSEHITSAIEGNPRIRIVREEMEELAEGPLVVVASGPLTSKALSGAVSDLVGSENLYFYDAIAPIVDAAGIDFGKAYRLSRYGKGDNDYVNCPMTREEYVRFYEYLLAAEAVSPRPFEDLKVFEGCMPIEVMARRGYDTMRFGPLKPVGLADPRTGRNPYAVVQLRSENRECSAYNLVGFQTRLTRSCQRNLLALIPGLEGAEILRFGSMHRNTFINSPRYLQEDLSCRVRDTVYFAGQITGVEGYVESTALGMIAGINVSRRARAMPAVPVPPQTAHGALIRHITTDRGGAFQPSNINYGLMTIGGECPEIRDKRLRRQHIARRALRLWGEYLTEVAVGGTICAEDVYPATGAREW